MVYERADADGSEGATYGDVSSFLDLRMLRDLVAGGSCLPQPLLDSRHLAFYQVADCESAVQPLVLVLRLRYRFMVL